MSPNARLLRGLTEYLDRRASGLSNPDYASKGGSLGGGGGQKITIKNLSLGQVFLIAMNRSITKVVRTDVVRSFTLDEYIVITQCAKLQVSE